MSAGAEGQRADRGRRITSFVLLALACVVGLLGTLMLYARVHVFDSQEFAHEAVQTLDSSDVRDVISRQITTRLIEQASPDLISVRPVIEGFLSSIIDNENFKRLFRNGVETAHRNVFEGEDDAVVVIANAGILAKGALEKFAPDLAKEIPKNLDSTLLKLAKGKFFEDTVQFAESIRVAGIILPLLAVAMFVGSIAVAPRRRSAFTRVGLAIATEGLLAMAALLFARELVLGRFAEGVDHAAAGAVWGAFLGPLQVWLVVITGFGVVIASASASLLEPFDLAQPLRWVWERVAREPATPRGRIVWALATAAVGLVLVIWPTVVVRLLVVIVGAYLLSRAVSAVIVMVSAPEEEGETVEERRRRALGSLVRAVAIVAGLVAIVVVAVIVIGGASKRAAAESCNGSPKLCERPLNEVVFPATHNSMAGADYPGFVFPEQDTTIPTQLEDGVRGLWIDTYYGVPGNRVFTRTDLIDPALNAQLREELGDDFSAAGERIRKQIATGGNASDQKAHMYLCHGFCELGAVDAEKAFSQIAEFLGDNPGAVILIDLEDYTKPADTVKVIEDSGLGKYVYKGPVGPPWPTLGEMVEKDQRAVVFSEHRQGGAPWYRKGYKRMWQETPFDFKQPSEMNCDENRGRPGNSLFLINHWINTDPLPKPSKAERVNAYRFLLDRARRCKRQRQLPNALAVDFYKRGDVFDVVDKLNGISISKN